MPELPEVEVVRRGLAAHILGRRIRSARVLHPRAVRRQPGGAPEFAALLGGRTITGTGRRGKFLWLVTDDPHVLLAAHLGMSGQFRIDRAGAPSEVEAGHDHTVREDPPGRISPPSGQPEADSSAVGPPVASQKRSDLPTAADSHARALLELDGLDLWFVDQRTFGWVWAAAPVADPTGEQVPAPVRDIARDPADPHFDPRVVARAMRRRHVEVKRLLLDQSLVSGIGNIYADEALWRAGVHPRRRADALTLTALVGVLVAAAEVMAESLALGGTSFDTLYVDVNGRSGYFGRGLAVYGRAGLPCLRCGTPVRREAFMSRSSHFCPRCQPAPRRRG